MMKKLFLFLFLLSTHSAFAQMPLPAIHMPELEQQVMNQSLLFGFWNEIPNSELRYVNTVKVHIDDVESVPADKKINPERIPFVTITEEPHPDGIKRQTLDIITAFWYSDDVPDNELKKLMTAGHSRSPSYEPLKQVLDSGHNVIPTIGGFKASETEHQLRQRIGWYKETFERIGWENIEYIILADEPYPKGFTTAQLEWIVDEAIKQYKAKVTFSFTRGSILREDLPENLKTIAINFYPFFRDNAPDGYAQIFDYEAFKEHVDLVLGAAREKVPNAEFILTVQVFGSKDGHKTHWRMPEPETAEWYMKTVAENSDIIGLTFWAWETEAWNGLKTNPELQTAWVNALKKYTLNL